MSCVLVLLMIIDVMDVALVPRGEPLLLLLYPGVRLQRR
jgi:hypothetical protein